MHDVSSLKGQSWVQDRTQLVAVVRPWFWCAPNLRLFHRALCDSAIVVVVIIQVLLSPPFEGRWVPNKLIQAETFVASFWEVPVSNPSTCTVRFFFFVCLSSSLEVNVGQRPVPSTSIPIHSLHLVIQFCIAQAIPVQPGHALRAAGDWGAQNL